MLLQRFYYLAKPVLPFNLRIGFRRWRARRLRERFHNVWPIDEAAGKKPLGWSGWPAGKRFALVLTHDVESKTGMDRVQALAQFEIGLGFRSSFNFIPEGGYRLDSGLRDWLINNGFEIGVHDLRHDGKLFHSRRDFARKALRINQHLKTWRAVGFRSGFMLRNLDWMHDLDVLYDASTFDTDPFEPQPDGVGTIFPFWVPAPLNPQSALRTPHSEGSPSGYVELPYTLAQDSTLFLLFQEKTVEIWKQKLDWIVQHNGMAMLNVHPDYVHLNGDEKTRVSYPVRLYADFLAYVKERYAGQYWLALPKEVAQFAKERMAPASDVVVQGRQKVRPRRQKIWIDLDNTPHVPFFEPIIEELSKRGYDVVLTARDAFQVCELADKKGMPYIKIGRHYGKNKVNKVLGLFYRAMQLAPFALREKPDLALSHGARSQIIISNLLGIPTLLMADYEFAQYPPLMRPTWEMVPEVIPDEALYCARDRIRKYPGIKEDVYVSRMRLDPGFLSALGVSPDELLVTVRPPATEAHYHNPEAEKLFERFMDRACQQSNVRVILLPRNSLQGETIRKNWPRWFEGSRTIIPRTALDGLNLLWHSDLVVSGGGTMNREAAALGVPVYSIFRGKTGAIDLFLQREGRLIMVETVQDVDQKIEIVRRVRRDRAIGETPKALAVVVDHVADIARSYLR